MPLVWSNYGRDKDTSPSVNNLPKELSRATADVTGEAGYRMIAATVQAVRNNLDGNTRAKAVASFQEAFTVQAQGNPNPKLKGEFIYKIEKGGVSANDSTTTGAIAEVRCVISFRASGEDSQTLFELSKPFHLHANGTPFYTEETDEVKAADLDDIVDIGPIDVSDGDQYILKGEVKIDELECRISQHTENNADPVDGQTTGQFEVSKARIHLWLE